MTTDLIVQDYVEMMDRTVSDHKVKEKKKKDVEP